PAGYVPPPGSSPRRHRGIPRASGSSRFPGRSPLSTPAVASGARSSSEQVLASAPDVARASVLIAEKAWLAFIITSGGLGETVKRGRGLMLKSAGRAILRRRTGGGVRCRNPRRDRRAERRHCPSLAVSQVISYIFHEMSSLLRGVP